MANRVRRFPENPMIELTMHQMPATLTNHGSRSGVNVKNLSVFVTEILGI
jgi:hypothetical protein